MGVAEAFDLTGRVAIVTGAARGLGAGMARVLCDAGAHVVLTDVLDDVDVTAKDLRSGGATCEAARLDVRDRAAVMALIDTVVERHGHLDVMVNNAGVIGDAPPSTVTEDELDRVLAVNFKGAVFGSQAAAAVMVPAGRGSIVNLTSGAVDMAIPAVAAYAAAKAALAQFSRSLALELAGTGVRVNAVAPGWVGTPMNERHALRPDGTLDSERMAAYTASRVATIPVGRAGTPDDIAMAVLYLAADASSFTTGSVLRPNGGMTMPW